MNVVLSIEAVRPPLAGIGRYVWELATRLPQSPEIESLRFMSDGLWRALPKLDEGSTQETTRRTDWRHLLGKSPLVSRVYGALMPRLSAFQLGRLRETVYHGPNFFVPKISLPTVVTIHDLSAYENNGWHPQTRVDRMRDLIPRALQMATIVLTDSEAIRTELLSKFDVNADKIVAIPLGVDRAYCRHDMSALRPVLDQYGLQGGSYSLFVSTIEPRKNVQALLAAYARLPEALRQLYPIVLTGGVGWNSAEIHEQMAQASAQGWLKYLGYVPQQHLPVLYAGARLFTYPSLYEGFGLPIAEAMASGTPVLTSNCSSMPEVAAGAAILVDPHELDSIEHGLQQGLTDETWRGWAKQRGLERAAELSWDACVAKTLLAYKMAYSTAK